MSCKPAISAASPLGVTSAMGNWFSDTTDALLVSAAKASVCEMHDLIVLTEIASRRRQIIGAPRPKDGGGMGGSIWAVAASSAAASAPAGQIDTGQQHE